MKSVNNLLYGFSALFIIAGVIAILLLGDNFGGPLGLIMIVLGIAGLAFSIVQENKP